MNVNSERMYALLRAMTLVFKDEQIEVVMKDKWSVSWRTSGVVSAEDARDGSDFLDKAADLVDHLNWWGVRCDGKSDPALEWMECERLMGALNGMTESIRIDIIRRDWDMLKEHLVMSSDRWIEKGA